MTFANVNIGSYAGDNTGDPLRTAFDKINKNFANITAGNISVTLNAPVMSVAGRTGNIVLNVNDVSGAVGLGRLNSTVNAANVAANAYTDAAISNLVNGAPLALDTLLELAEQLNDDTSAIAAITTSLNQTTINQNAANVLVYALGARVDSVELTNNAQAVSINTLTSNALAQSLELNRINANVTAANSAINSLQVASADHANSITDLEANAATQAYSLFVLTGNAAMQHTAIGELRANITAANAVIAEHTSQISSLLSNAAGQADQLTSLNANAATQSDALSVLVSNAATQAGSLSTLTANAATQAVSLTTLLANAATQGDSLQTLFSNAVSQAQSLTDLVGNAITQAESIQAIEADITTLQSNISTLESQVYNDSDTQAYLNAVAGNILPGTDVTYNLGSPDKRWKDIFLSNSTIYLGNIGISASQNGLTSTTGFNLGNSTATAIVTGDLYADYWVQGNIGVTGPQFQFTNFIDPNDTGSVNLLTYNGSLVYESTGGAFVPSGDNTERIGASDQRWAEMHANVVAGDYLYSNAISSLNVVNVASEVAITDVARLYRLDTDTVAIETFANLNLTSTGRTQIAAVGNIELDTGGAGNVVITTGGIVMPDGSYLTTASAVDLGNIRFSGDSITSTENGDKGITINASGFGEVVVSDNLGVNNTNPAYTVDIGNINENENTGAIGINFNNNVESVGHRYGSALIGWDWWDQNGHGTNNDGTEHYRFGIYNGNTAPFTHAWLSFDKDAPADSIVVDNVGAVNVKKIVTNITKSNVQVRHTEVESTAPDATEPIDIITGTQWIHTANTTQNFEFNIRGNSSVALDSFLGVGETITVQYTVHNSDPAYYLTGVKIDNVTQTVNWLNGVPPSSGTVGGYDLYNFFLTKVSANTYVILGQQQKYS